MSAQFIADKTNLLPENPAYKQWAKQPRSNLIGRWNTPEGKCKIATLRSDDLTDQTLQEFGKYKGQIDLRGIPLPHAKFNRLTLDNIDFYAADLSECVFSSCSLKNCWLSEANIRGTKFEWCDMQGVLIDKPTFNEETTFTGINLSQINFTLAILLQDLAEDQRRIQHLESSSPILAKLLKYSCNYGRSLGRWLAWVLGTIFVFAVIFQFTQTGAKSFFDTLYFSFVTFTTLGYGDIVPLSTAAKIWVILETFTGYIMGGLLVAILARKVMGR